MASAADPAAGLLLLIPMIGLIPAYIIALILFVPVEALAARMRARWLANILIPLTGGIGAILCIIALSVFWGEVDVMMRNISNRPEAFAVWIGLGILWGTIWRMTAMVRLIPFIRRRMKPV